MIHEFRLSPSGRGHGTSCDESGAFVGAVPLLTRSNADGAGRWEPRECGQLSKEVGSSFGLPIDMSSKLGGLKAISNALNEGNIARAQIAAVLLAIPEPPPLVKGARPRADMIRFIRDLHWSGMIVWDEDASSMASGVAASEDVTPLKIEGRLAKANFNPNELRSEHGQWARDGADEWPVDSEVESLAADVGRGAFNFALDTGELAVRALSVEVPGLDDLTLPHMESARLPYTNPVVGYSTELGLGFAIPGTGEADAALGGTKAFEAFGNRARAVGLGGVIDRSATGVQWGGGIAQQGLPFQKWVVSQLPEGTLDLNSIKSNFSTFDAYNPNTREAINIKTLDTNAPSYRSPQAITRTLNGIVGSTLDFEIDGSDAFVLTPKDIDSRGIQLGVPTTTTPSQWAAINSSIDYAQLNGVRLVITQLK